MAAAAPQAGHGTVTVPVVARLAPGRISAS